MLELLAMVVFVWLLGGVFSLVFKVTWGAAKVAVWVLAAAAAVGLTILGGIVVLVPLVLIGIVVALVRTCG